MTLILGLHTPSRLWLAADTRVTQGSIHRDDLIKSVTFNSLMTAVAAGGVGTAAYILKRLKEWCDPETTITEMRRHLDANLESPVRECVSDTGFLQETKMILGGFDPSIKKKISSGRLGDIMATEPRLAGEGVRVEQSIDPKILTPLGQAIQKHNGLEGHTPIELDYAHSALLRIETSPQEPYFTIEEVPVFGFTAFHPGWERFSILVPPVQVARLAIAPPEMLLSNLYEVSGQLMTVVSRQAAAHGMRGVGGNIVALMLDPDRGAVFATGDIAHVTDDGSIEASSFTVEGQRYRYRLPDGSTGYYRLLENVDLPGEAEI